MTTHTAVLDPPPWVGAPQPRPVPRPVLAGLAGLVVLAAGWAWAGLHPSLTALSSAEAQGLERVTEASGATTWRAAPTGGTVVLPVRNTGLLPVTLSRPESPAWTARVHGFAALGADGTVARTDTGPVTLLPGRTASVVVRVGVAPPYCTAFTPGSTGTARDVPLDVRTLGLVTTHLLPLDLPVTVTAPSPECR